MTYEERALTFQCEDASLLGIISAPVQPRDLGVIIVVGGPQYRVGSHRQFTLLARHLAKHGIPSLRFDYRGMGDSEGSRRDFEAIGADIRSAVDTFLMQLPELKQVALWGLCDAASAALFYARSDARVNRLVLLNPWVHTEQGAAKAYMKQYYVRRIVDPDLWRKIRQGKFSYSGALKSFFSLIKARVSVKIALHGAAPETARACGQTLPDRVLNSLAQFRGRVLLILSGNDFTAQEFIDAANGGTWKKVFKDPRLVRHDIKAANHTFSKKLWRDEVAQRTVEWLNE